MTEKNLVALRVRLEGDMRKKFLDLKKKWGMENNTDIVRMIIAKIHEEEFHEKQ